MKQNQTSQKEIFLLNKGDGAVSLVKWSLGEPILVVDLEGGAPLL